VTHPEGVEDAAAKQAEDDDWAWRRKLRARSHTRLAYRIAVFFLGLLLVVGGLALVPLPGPGWLIVIFGLIVWASEFERAESVLHWLRRQLYNWNDWLQRQAIWVKSAVALLTAAAVAGFFYAILWLSGVPTYLPDGLESWLAGIPGLGS
jgi:uncharacterized protein (TIGR02611 family)